MLANGLRMEIMIFLSARTNVRLGMTMGALDTRCDGVSFVNRCRLGHGRL